MRTAMLVGLALMGSLILTGCPQTATAGGRAAGGANEDYLTPPPVAPLAAPIKVGNMQVQIARWYQAKRSAISIQFEGSDPSQLTTAIPVINQYGRQPFVGTFYPDRASESYQTRRQEWEAAIRDGGHEFGPAGVKAPRVFTVGADPAQADVVGIAAFRQRVDESVATEGWTSFSFRAVEPGTGRGGGGFQQMMSYLQDKRYRWDAWIGGVDQIRKYQVERDAAKVTAAAVGPTKIKIDVECNTDPKAFDQPLTIQVDWQPRWPFYGYDVEVLDRDGKQIPALRQYMMGPPIMIAVPPSSGTYYVNVVDPRASQPAVVEEARRSASDPATGLAATICPWYDGRKGAVMFRFDDSHPTHILTAIPMLREYGYRGTFFLCPGSPGFREQRAAWEACAARGDQEFANHTMHHQGAANDAEAEQEIGGASQVIWGLLPGKSKLACFSAGGGTVWTYGRTLRSILDQYELFSFQPRLGISMTDSAAENYRRILEQTIETKVSVMVLFHQIEKGAVSVETFRAVLETTKTHDAEIWVAGMADVFKYQEERNASALALRSGPGGSLTLAVTCGTDRARYDQALTIELALPDGWSAQTLKVRGPQGTAVASRAAIVDGRQVVRFDVPPANGEFTLSR